ncbi:Rrp15p family protein [Theileria parva strain Muguga]|uniref:Rrp15p family protein n=1 Tax=Theileria parva strain Muguga TaxID=333668 RepID=UPI001C623ADD|nr:Rrp15p family protein [Theileria parva strain Muguga]EAN33906.2 Rrp15p family protein [Theileria parva strain Muguga]
MESKEDLEDKSSMFKGFSKAFTTVSKKTKDKISKEKKPEKEPEKEPEPQSSTKSNRKLSVRIPPKEYSEELEKKYKRIATKGVKKLFILLNNAR